MQKLRCKIRLNETQNLVGAFWLSSDCGPIASFDFVTLKVVHVACISMNELYSEFSELGLSYDLVCSVTFSRLEPEGKLVMGFRKSSTVPSDQV